MYIDTVDETLRLFRQTLPAGSATAAAIDRQAGLTAISQCAAAEGLHALAGLLFQVELTELCDHDEPAEVVQVAHVLQDFRHYLPTASKTAAALERHAPWDEISQCAETEGLRQHSVTAVLCAAQQERLRQRRVRAPLRSARRRRSAPPLLQQPGRRR